jgi:hypothetical protein
LISGISWLHDTPNREDTGTRSLGETYACLHFNAGAVTIAARGIASIYIGSLVLLALCLDPGFSGSQIGCALFMIVADSVRRHLQVVPGYIETYP